MEVPIKCAACHQTIETEKQRNTNQRGIFHADRFDCVAATARRCAEIVQENSYPGAETADLAIAAIRAEFKVEQEKSSGG